MRTLRRLNNGNWIPNLGLGTYLVSSNEHTYKILHKAYSCGYRLIDTARMYGNEEDIGWSIRKLKDELKIERCDFFITTKLMPKDTSYKGAYKSIKKSLKELKTDYIDLYLIHWPGKNVKERINCWKAMEELYNKGIVKNIGVSNFTTKHLKDLISESTIIPCINQIEVHPLYADKDTIEYCKNKNILIQSYSPFAQKSPRLMEKEVLKRIKEKYEKSVAQVILRWNYQKEFIGLPRSNNTKHIEENANIFDFELSEDDMKQIDLLNEMQKVEWNPYTL